MAEAVSTYTAINCSSKDGNSVSCPKNKSTRSPESYHHGAIYSRRE